MNLCSFALRRFPNEAKLSRWQSFFYGFSLSLMKRKGNRALPGSSFFPERDFHEKRNGIAIMQIAPLSKHH
jgi:hypothetical protein